MCRALGPELFFCLSHPLEAEYIEVKDRILYHAFLSVYLSVWPTMITLYMFVEGVSE